MMYVSYMNSKGILKQPFETYCQNVYIAFNIGLLALDDYMLESTVASALTLASINFTYI